MLEFLNGYIGGLLVIVYGVFFAKATLYQKVVVSKTKLIILCLLITLFLQVLYLLEINVARSVATFIIYAILFKYSFNIDYGKSVFVSFFYILIVALSDIIVVLVFVSFGGLDFFYNELAGTIISNICVLIPLIGLTFLLKKLVYKMVSIKNIYKVIVISIFILICIITVLYDAFSSEGVTANGVIGVFSIIVLLIVSSFFFFQFYKNSTLTEKYDKLFEFIKKYEVELDNQRMIRHETKNQLLTIKSKIIDKDHGNSIVKYIDEIINDNKIFNYTEYAKYKSLPSNGLKGLFYFKTSEAKDKNISVDINVSNDIEKSFLNDLSSASFNQVGKIIGVYLDNAIEAAENSNKKEIGIEVFMKNEDIIFIISNSYNNKYLYPIIGKSSKGIGRGYGLLLANSIINNNKKYHSSTEVTDELYIQKFVVRKNC